MIPECIRVKSKKFPPLSVCPAVDLFVKMVTKDFEALPTSICNDNLTSEQRSSLKKLRELKDILFKPADKGGNLVVWPKKQYETEAYRQLRDRTCYQKLSFNPLISFRQKLDEILNRYRINGVITKKLQDTLTVEDPVIPTLYLLPKVHKNPKIPPGRPIISGNGSLTEKLGRYIDFQLKGLVECLPSYTRDTTDLLCKIDGIQLERDMILVICDIESLYTSIKHEDGLRATSYFLRGSGMEDSMSDFLIELLQFTLTHNFFVFNGSFFLQLQGTAMGAPCAPSYANLFLGLWERDLFLSDHEGVAMDRVIFWTRYIDDIFMIWQGSSSELHEFIERLNSNSYNIRLTYKWNHEKVDFLDVIVKRDSLGYLQSDVFRKETSVNSLLHATSSHPIQTINAIPTGQYLRMRRICSSEEDFARQANDLQQRFLNRGYSRRSTKRAYKRALNCTHRELIHKKKTHKPEQKVRFITDYHSRWSTMREIVKKHWSILLSDSILENYLTTYPSITARRAQNLRDCLVRSHYQNTGPGEIFGTRGPRQGCIPCGRCVACPNIERATEFENSTGTRKYNILKSITCTTKAVVYYATCTCPKIYVGLTSRALKIRVREHVRDIIAAKEALDLTLLKPIPRHFRKKHNCDPKMLKVRGIDCINSNIRGGNTNKRLSQCESKWIWRLKTVQPLGLNENLSFAPFL